MQSASYKTIVNKHILAFKNTRSKLKTGYKIPQKPDKIIQ